MAGPSREQMRADFRAAVPVLQAEGWSVAEIEAISPAIREAGRVGDEGLLMCWANWLEEVAMRCEREVRQAGNAVRLEDMVIRTRAERDDAQRVGRLA